MNTAEPTHEFLDKCEKKRQQQHSRKEKIIWRQLLMGMPDFEHIKNSWRILTRK